MASKSKRIVSLDIGTSKVQVVVADVLSDGQSPLRIHVVAVGRAPSRGLRKGVVIHIDGTIASIGEAIGQAESMIGSSITKVVASVSGAHVQSFNSHGIVGIREGEVSKLDVEKVIEAARAVAIPHDRVVLHVLPQGFVVDKQDAIRNPLGISGVRLESRVHIVSCSSSGSHNVVKSANKCGLSVDKTVLAPLSSAWAVLTPEEQELGACLLDIGGGTCGIVVFQNGAVLHSAVLPIGGNHITNDIAAGLRTPIAAAEEIKKDFGTVSVQQVNPMDTIEVPSTGGRSPRVLSRSILAEIIEPRVRELFHLVAANLRENGVSLHTLSSGLVLTGGTSHLQGICELGEEVFSAPVRSGGITDHSGHKITGLFDLVAGPDSSAAIGGIICTTKGREGELFHPESGKFSGMLRRVGAWMAEHF